jgi:hypothetical protein
MKTSVAKTLRWVRIGVTMERRTVRAEVTDYQHEVLCGTPALDG